MDADTFAARLLACAPSIENGLSSDDLHTAQAFVAEFVCKKRPGMDKPSHDNPLIDLVQRYDMSSVRIGLVSFRSTIDEISGKLWFAKAEADPLVIDPESSRIQLLDHAALPYVICECASSGAQFLDALLAGIEARPDTEPFDGESPEVPSVSLQCARIAGSEDYWPFYRDILGWGLDE